MIMKMKKLISILVLSFCIAFSITLHTEMINDIEISNYYDSNILNLSDHTLDEFSNGLNLQKFRLDTTDDFISAVSFTLGTKHKIFNHTQLHKLYFKFEKYWNNDIKDNYFTGLSVKRFFSSKINLELKYLYYPEIYLNQYKSSWDSNDIYREFAYSKNFYKLRFFYKANNIFNFIYTSKFTQLFFNKYFTEYDSNQFENGIESRLSFFKLFKMNLGYSYKISNAEGETAHSASDIYKDWSYKQDEYQVELLFPAIKFIRMDLAIQLFYYERYYTANNIEDSYHINREDYNISYDLELSQRLSDKFKLELFGSFKQRTTTSPYQYVVEDKNYNKYVLGIEVSYE